MYMATVLKHVCRLLFEAVVNEYCYGKKGGHTCAANASTYILIRIPASANVIIWAQ